MVQHTIQTSISREKLSKRSYLPDKITLIQSAPMDADHERKFYEPAVKLLDMIAESL